MSEKKTFFISRAGADKRWAELIASVVRDAGHEAIHQDEHFRVGQSFIDNMTRAAEADCTIAILSPAYFESEYCLAELNAALVNDPLGRRGRVIPVRVAPIEIPRLIGQLAYLDLVGVGDDAARQRLLGILLKHGQVDASKLALVGRTRRVVEQANRNRHAMIEKVRTIWITGYLRKSLFDEVRAVLGLNERPDAVVRPMDLLVKPPDQGERRLPSGTQVIEVFDTMDRSLLILGAAGSGKTTLLLELARDLLTRATSDSEHPIPVVFPLSTWAESRRPLAGWMMDELILRYDVPSKVAKDWVESDQVLPLLDGLDEVKSEHRAACVEAINAFRKSHGFLPLVITSRTVDYEALAKPLRLQGAIQVQPLTREQLIGYLTELGPAGEPVRTALHEDSSLWELMDSPLLLFVITVTYAGQTKTQPLARNTKAERRDRLLESYVNQMLERRAVERRYTPKQTVRWLSWLADQMAKHGQTAFYLERLQLDWLPQTQRQAVRFWNGLVAGLVAGLGAGLDLGLVVGLVAGLDHGLVGGLIFGLIGGPLVGLFFGVFFGLAPDQEISCVETVRWSWSEFRDAMSRTPRTRLVLGLFGGLVGGLVWGLVGMLGVGLYGGLGVGLFGGLLSGLTYGLAGGLFNEVLGGLVVGEIETKALPNEGIRRSARNALVVGLIGGLIGGPVFVLVAGLVFGLVFAMTREFGDSLGVALRFGLGSGMLGALVFGLIFGLKAGGWTCLKHIVLRLWLILNGSTPWNYVKFLDYAAGRILLRKVGGGYMFIHRMLLEHFASRYVEPPVKGAMSKKPSSIKAP
jgi:TIR domain/NACHT domain